METCICDVTLIWIEFDFCIVEMSAAKVPTVAPIYGSPCAEKLMSVALSVRCSRLFKRVLVASTYPTTSRHIEEAHEKWNSIGFSSRLHFKGPEEAYEDSFLEKDDLISEWKKEHRCFISDFCTCRPAMDWRTFSVNDSVQPRPVNAKEKASSEQTCGCVFKYVCAWHYSFFWFACHRFTSVTMLTSRALHVVKTRKPVSDSVAQDVHKLFENAIGLGLAGLQSQIDTVRRSANHWYE